MRRHTLAQGMQNKGLNYDFTRTQKARNGCLSEPKSWVRISMKSLAALKFIFSLSVAVQTHKRQKPPPNVSLVCINSICIHARVCFHVPGQTNKAETNKVLELKNSAAGETYARGWVANVRRTALEHTAPEMFDLHSPRSLAH
jgi:hypothetical protein